MTIFSQIRKYGYGRFCEDATGGEIVIDQIVNYC